MRFDQTRAQHRRQRQRDERGDGHRTADDDAKFFEEPARQTLQKNDGHEHRDQCHRRRNHRKENFLRAFEPGLNGIHAVFNFCKNIFQHHNGIVHDHADGEHQSQQR